MDEQMTALVEAIQRFRAAKQARGEASAARTSTPEATERYIRAIDAHHKAEDLVRDLVRAIIDGEE